MLFDACDAGVPTIARSGTAFGATVAREHLGWTFDAIAEIPAIVDRLCDAGVRNAMATSIEASNAKRLRAVLEWLG
jgi:hypothetical protein